MRLVALLQAKDEARFLPGWLDNVGAIVDRIVVLDDGSTDGSGDLVGRHPKVEEVLRNEPGQPWDERANQIALVQAGRQLGAEWMLCLDADERLELAFAERVHEVLNEAERDGIRALRFDLREMWDPSHYRVDGVWGMKVLYRLFRDDPDDRRFDPRQLHRFWMPLEVVSQLETVGRHSGRNIYHLRMIDPADRLARVARYEAMDPDHLYQKLGYQYLLDESTLELEAIPPGREYVAPQEESRQPG